MALVVVGAILAVAALVLATHRARGGGNAVLAIGVVGVLARIFVGFLNSKYGPFPGADVDAVAFFEVARGLAADLNVGASGLMGLTERYFYANVLASLFRPFGPSPLIVSAWHGLLFVLTLVVVDGLLLTERVSVRWRVAVGLALSLHLPSVLYGAVALREAPLVFLLAVFSTATLELARGESRWITIGLSLAGLVLLHPGFAVLLGLPVFAPTLVLGKDGIRRTAVALSLAIAVVVMVVRSVDILSVPRLARFVGDSGELEAAQVGVLQGAKARGDGSYQLHFPPVASPVLSVVLAAPEAFGRLLFSPLPWEWRPLGAARTIFKAFDVLLFAGTIALLIVRMLRAPTKAAIVLASLVLVLGAVFGIVTSNDGVAMRHRAKFAWIIVAAAAVARRPEES